MMEVENNQHLTYIDGLKGIGAFIIAFIWHYQHFGLEYASPFNSLFKLSYIFGWGVVDLFFMLSGFCMMIGYADKIFNKEISFGHYFLKRLKKLYPLFIFSTFLVFALELLFLHKTGETFIYSNFDIYHVILNLFLLQDGFLGTEYSLNGPAWCIPIFFVCYCLLYFIIYRAKDLSNVFYAFFTAAIIACVLIATGLEYPLLNSQMGRGIANFSIGILLFFVYKNRTKFKTKKLGYCCLLFLIGAYLLLRFKSVDLSGHYTLSMILGFAPMIILSTMFVPFQNAIIRNPAFKYLGIISCEIYLFHFPIQCCIKLTEIYLNLQINYSSKFAWLLYVLITVCFSSLYHFLLSKKIENIVLGFFK